MSLRITRWVETDTGHRVPNHKSHCRNLHGHRYRWEAEVEGTVVQSIGASDEGMVVDFSDIKEALMTRIHDVVDHAFVVYEGDAVCRQALDLMGTAHRTVVVDFIPTAENLARWAFEQVAPMLEAKSGNQLRLHAMTVRETPTSSARWCPED